MLSPRERDRLKRHYKNMTARQFFAEGRKLTRRSQELMDRNRWDEHEKNEQKLNVWTSTQQQMRIGHEEEQQTTTKFKKDDRVRHRGRLGRIEHIHRDGSYTIRYADGDRDRYVFQQDIHKLSTSSSSATHRFRRGDKVMASFREGQRAYPGTIQHVHRNGTYSIQYDDGDFEQHVPANKITLRRTRSPSFSPPASPLSSPSSSSPPYSPLSSPRGSLGSNRIRTPVASPIRSSRGSRNSRTCRQKEGNNSCSMM